MIRAAREHPRLLAAQVIAALSLVGCGLALGPLLASGAPAIPRAAQLQIDAAKRDAQTQSAGLADARANLNANRTVLAATRTRLRATRRVAVKLRAQLRHTTRALRRERRR